MSKFILGLLLGVFVAQSPDLFGVAFNRVMDKYEDAACKGKAKCNWNQDGWYDQLREDYPKMLDLHHYFQLSYGPLYFGLTGRCATKPVRPGAVSPRKYFSIVCGDLTNDISDLFYE